MSDFKTLYAIDVNEHTQTKNGLTYLKWSWAWAEFKKNCPDATYDIWRDPQTNDPFTFNHQLGYMVYTSVTSNGETLSMWLPVMDGANKAQTDHDYEYQTRSGAKTCVAATYFDINSAIMRCLVKNLGMFGLGLYIYTGTQSPEAPDLSSIPAHKVVLTGGKFEGFELGELATKGGIEGLGHLKWLSTNSSAGEVMNAKALEVYEKHAPDYTDEQVTDLIADAEQPGELSGLYRLLTDEQKFTFKEALSVRKQEITETKEPRDAAAARG